MKAKLTLVAALLLLATGVHAQNMTPAYTFTQTLTNVGGSNTVYEVTEQVTGYTTCSGNEGCNGAMHYVQLEAKMGSDDEPFLSGDFNPTDTINYYTSAQANVPITSMPGKLWGEVDCTIRGRFAAESHPVGSAHVDAYWESQITFFQAEPIGGALVPNCGFSGDTSPDWNPVLGNPLGGFLYYHAIQLAYASTAQPGQGKWTGFPYLNVHNAGGQTGNYGIDGWYHLSNGTPATMPQICTQNQSGKIVENPSWISNPN